MGEILRRMLSFFIVEDELIRDCVFFVNSFNEEIGFIKRNSVN